MRSFERSIRLSPLEPALHVTLVGIGQSLIELRRFDEAVAILKKAFRRNQLYIADVAHYVRPGSALDREALKRGNSVYFPDRVVPMLPERISNDLCSLRAQRGPRGARGPHDHRPRRPQALAHASTAC